MSVTGSTVDICITGCTLVKISPRPSSRLPSVPSSVSSAGHTIPLTGSPNIYTEGSIEVIGLIGLNLSNAASNTTFLNTTMVPGSNGVASSVAPSVAVIGSSTNVSGESCIVISCCSSGEANDAAAAPSNPTASKPVFPVAPASSICIPVTHGTNHSKLVSAHAAAMATSSSAPSAAVHLSATVSGVKSNFTIPTCKTVNAVAPGPLILLSVVISFSNTKAREEEPGADESTVLPASFSGTITNTDGIVTT